MYELFFVYVHKKTTSCGVSVDAQEHWLLRCHGVATEREERWEKVESEVGGWVRLLTVKEQHLLMAGRIPVKAQKRMWWKGVQRQNETQEQAMLRLQ